MTSARELVAQGKLRLERARARYPLVDITIRVFKRFGEDEGSVYAASLTYYLFFSIFPLLLFAISALGYLTFLNEELRGQLLTAGISQFPLLQSFVSPDALTTAQEQRGVFAVAGLLLGLYSGSGGVVALEHALNKIQHMEEEPGFIPKRIRSLKWLVAVALAAIVSVGLSTLSQVIGALLGSGVVVTVLLQVVLVVAGIAVSTAIFLAAFKFLPALDRPWKDVLPGALIAGVVFEILKFLGGAYLQSGSQSRAETFGAFAAAAGLLVAAYLLAQITLLASEVNAVLAERRRTRQPALFANALF